MIEAVIGPIVGAAAVITVMLAALYRTASRAAVPARRRPPQARRTAA